MNLYILCNRFNLSKCRQKKGSNPYRFWILTLFFLLISPFFSGHVSAWDANQPGLLKVTALKPEVITGGVGLCLVFQTPEGKTFLYDTANGNDRGENPEACENTANNGRDIIIPWLEAHGIHEINGLIISHAHADHFGGFLWMSRHFPIHELWDSGYIRPGTDAKDYHGEQGLYHRLRDEFAAAHPGKYHTVKAGDFLDWGRDLKVEVVWPPQEFTPILENPDRMKRDGETHHLINANAVAIQVTYKNVKFFVVGDIQEDYLKERMIPFLPAEKWKCDVCILPSHGIHTIPEEVELTSPKIAVSCMGEISWGWGIPKNIRRFYEPYGTQVFSTAESGHVTVLTDGTTLEVQTEQP